VSNWFLFSLELSPVLQEALQKFSWVWWADSSARFRSPDLQTALQYSRDHSVLYFTYGRTLSIARHTSNHTMRFLGEDYCKFRHFGEVEASFVLFHLDDVTQTLVQVWSACAMQEECMAPTRARLACRSVDVDGFCHRFDQSVLSIMLRRLFHRQHDYPAVDTPIRIHELRRGHVVKFFPS